MICKLTNEKERAYVISYVKNIKFSTKKGKLIKYTCDVTKTYKNRSIKINKYYWFCLEFVYIEGCTNEPQDQHKMLKQMFLKGFITNKVSGEICEYTKSTTELDNKEFVDYLENIKNYYALNLPDMGKIPDANEIPDSEYEKYSRYKHI